MFIGITTYGNINEVIQKLELIYSPSNVYWIHYNKRDALKHPRQYKKLKKYFKKYNNVHVYTKYKVYWGHYSITKSLIDLQKKFIKTNEDIFIHMDAKITTLFDIDETEKKIKEMYKLGFNFMNFNFDYLKDIGIDNKRGHIEARRKYPEYFTRRRFFYKTIEYNSKYWKLHRYLLFLINPKNILSFLKHGIRKGYNNWYVNCDVRKNVDCITSIISNRDKRIPNLLKNWEFKFYNVAGPSCVLNREDLIKISNDKSNPNRKFVKSLQRFIKNVYITDEMYTLTLYWNLVSKDLSKTMNVIAYKDINSEEDIDEFVNNLYTDNLLFIRRITSSEYIPKLRNKIAKKHHDSNS